MKYRIVSFLIFCFGTSQGFTQIMNIENMRCEYQIHPLGIDIPHPRFSWQLSDTRRGACQQAYRVLVGTDSLALFSDEADMWDSKEVKSSTTNNITYAGKAFAPRTKYYWLVESKDKDNVLVKSPVQSFETAMWSINQWKGRWIDNGASIDSLLSPYFRKEVQLYKKIKSARAYITGLGYYHFTINGQKVGDELLAPAYSRFDKTIYYQTFDVTSYLQTGDNALGVILGNGWFNIQSKAVWLFHEAPWRRTPRFIMDMYITYEDGTTEVVCSDNSWKTSFGAILFNSLYSGEYYDARLEPDGWDKPGFDDSSWNKATQVRASRSQSRYLGELKSQFMQPIRIKREIKPVSFKKISDTHYLYDMGENFSGLSRIRVEGDSGTTLKIAHGEQLGKDGLLDLTRIQVHTRFEFPGEQIQTDRYTLKGSGMEEWMPKFTYHAYQYVEVESDKPIQLDINSLTGVEFYTDFEKIADFECSNALMNTILENGLRSYTSNYHGIPTDCPHREKNGWTGDAHIACEVGTYYYNPLLAYEKYMLDMRNEQVANGELPSIVPTSGWGFHYNGNVSWDAAFIMLPWYMYLYYGDDTLIKSSYDDMKKFMDYLEYLSKDNLQYSGLNDWCPYKSKTPAEITSSGNYYQMESLMARFAGIVGNQTDAGHYAALSERIRNRFNEVWFNADSASYANGTQTALGTAIYQRLVTDEWQQKVADRLAAKVHEDNDHLDFGLFGSKYVLNALSRNGYNDVAYTIASQKTYPSWGYWAEQGYTTFHESWNSGVSRNHIMFGEICAWMQKELAGINPDPAHPGYKHIIFRPGVDTPLTYVNASVGTIHGKVVCNWEKKKKNMKVHVIVPPNTTASLYLPAKGKLYEAGKPVLSGNEYISESMDNTGRVVSLQSGEYTFDLK